MNTALVIVCVLVALGSAVFFVYFFGSTAQRRRGPDSFALPTQTDQTLLDRLIAPLENAHPGMSGLQVLPNNMAAFAVRWHSARRAGRSLDLQYYYWAADLTGKLLCLELLHAADRGVKIRLLLDDMNSFGFDSTYLALDSHDNIEVRLFNPSRSRSNAFRRGIELVLKYFTATRRMHNKCWIADGRLAICGGRNIGDAYFDASAEANFQDIDVLAAGAAVAAAGEVFDRYWNSEPALPIRSLHKIRKPSLMKLRRRLEAFSRSDAARRYLNLARCHSVETPAFATPARFSWSADVDVMADPPEKAAGKRREQWLGERINALMKPARKSLFLISPYFIPGEAATKSLIALASGGVDVRILTNSLAATDVIAVHGAYARYRRWLAESPVHLHELKPEAGRHRASLFGSATASLHTKALLVDDETGFVGSFNLDPRSRSINTEMGIIFRCRPLAEQIRRVFETQILPETSYRVQCDKQGLVWTDTHDGKTRVHREEPDAPLRRSIPAALIAWLPIESQL